MPGNTIRFSAILDDKVSSKLSIMRDKFDSMGKGAASASLLGNVGAKVLATGMNLAADAMSHVVDFVGDASRAFIEDESSVRKLGTSLKANIAGWDGNTTAIEGVIDARRALGFSDEEQRNSLALLVGATHDSAKALDIQRTAMDLARLKGISLAEAGDALTKVEAGSYRILKSLGIVLKDGATQTDALAAVQAVAAGQAEDFAGTLEGKLLVSQDKVNESMEHLGAVSAPLMVAGTQLAAGAIEDFVLGLGVVGNALSTNRTDLSEASLNYGRFGTTVKAEYRDALATAPKMISGFGKMGDAVVGSLGKVSYGAGAMANAMDISTKSAAADFKTMSDKLVADTNRAIGDAYDPEINRLKLLADQAELSAARRVLASGKGSKAEIADAKATIASVTKDSAGVLLLLAQSGDTTSAAYKAGIKELKAEIKNSTGPTHAHLQSVYHDLMEIEKAGKYVPINFFLSANTDPSKNRHKAGGGHVNANEVYQVGEKGPEWFVSDKAGTIIPNGQVSLGRVGLGKGGSGGAYAPTINFNSIWPPSPAQAQAIADVVDRALYGRMAQSAQTGMRS